MTASDTVAVRLLCLLSIAGLAGALTPSTAVAAKTLASQALAAAVASGSINEVRQDLLMDLAQKQKYEFDEAGIEALGRSLCDQGDTRQGVEILQLNQMLFSESPAAANALGDAYLASGQEIPARVYYDMALRMDPENEHAKQATAGRQERQEPDSSTLRVMEVDPEEMQDAMAQAGVEMTPEQMEKMQQAMAQLETYQSDPAAVEAHERQQAEARQNERERRATAAAAEPEYKSEFCEVLHRFNAQKKIEEELVRARVEGEYGSSGQPNRTWNVETACGEFLIAVPLWADVSPPVMQVTGERSFSDALGGTWVFQMEGGQASGVVYTDSAGTVQEMKRLGDPRSFD